MQRLWLERREWDEELPPDIENMWKSLFKEMSELNNLVFERCLTPENAVGLPILTMFSDASKDAFGACAYVRWETENQLYVTRFLAARSSVAPLKPLSIPRLKLQAAVLAVRLAQTIREESRFQFEKTIFFIDSSIVLSWICSQPREFKPFVSARIAEIHNKSEPHQWRHISGELNVADEVSRGIPAERLTKRWYQGPEFVQMPEDEWPKQALDAVSQFKSNQSERRKPTVVLQTSHNENAEIIPFDKISCWKKLLRVTAYVRRFIHNARPLSRNQLQQPSDPNFQAKLNPLSAQELEEAEKYVTKRAQITLREQVKSGQLQQLSPFTDEDGLIRVGGRVDNAQVSFDKKQPILLPRKHQISLLITRYFHEIGHEGIATTVAKIRRKVIQKRRRNPAFHRWGEGVEVILTDGT